MCVAYFALYISEEILKLIYSSSSTCEYKKKYLYLFWVNFASISHFHFRLIAFFQIEFQII